jgi:hypothetical protein
MRKVFTTVQQKRHRRARARSTVRNSKTRRRKKRVAAIEKVHVERLHRKATTVVAPSDLRLLINTKACLEFFERLRKTSSIKSKRGSSFVEVSMSNTTEIDYSTISVLTALSDHLKYHRVSLRGDFPHDPACKKLLVDSGFLNTMLDENGRPFRKSPKSEMLFFQKGTGRFTSKDNMNISNAVNHIVKHLTGDEGFCQSIRTILLEICGNSIEWSGAENKQWLLGVRYHEDHVIVTVTDVGHGILKTLNRKWGATIADYFSRSSDEILLRAFHQKYGSSSRMVNRNKGLPFIRSTFERGRIRELKVITNDVVLHFDEPNRSQTFGLNGPSFRGTFYRWVVTKNCLQQDSTLAA